MRGIALSTALVGGLLLAGCSDPFGRERARTVADIELLEDECENLGLLVPRTKEPGIISISLRSFRGDQVASLRFTEGCRPCADHLEAVYGEYASPTERVAPEDPGFTASASQRDGVEELSIRRESMASYRDLLREYVENGDPWERDVEGLNDEQATWEDPVCAPSACQKIREAGREG